MQRFENRGRVGSLLVPCGFLLVVVGIQLWSGAYRSEMLMGDESAHFISGLMVRDYLATGLNQSPAAFAYSYYSHLPKVAIGNWPPLFYGVQGFWMLVFPAQPASILFLLALFAALLAWLVLLVTMPLVGPLHAFFAAGLLVLIRPLPAYAGMIMLEIPLALATTIAVGLWARYLDRPGVRELTWFTVASVVAVFIKWNGLFLLLVPPLSLVIGRRLSLLRSRALWIAAGIVAAIAVPWLWYFQDIVRSGWEEPLPSLAFIGSALYRYVRFFFRALGVAGVVALLVGIAGRLRGGVAPREGGTLWIVALSTLVAVAALHVVVPAGIEPRHLISSFPAVVVLVGRGTFVISRWLQERGVRPVLADVLVIGVVSLTFLSQNFQLPSKEVSGYRAAARAVMQEGQQGTSLIVSDVIGEGAFTVAAAVMDPARPCDVVWRGTKLLSMATWAGRDYRLRAADEAGVLRLLEAASIEYVVLDRANHDSPHGLQLQETIRNHPSRFLPIAVLPVARTNQRSPDGLAIYAFFSERDESSGSPRIRQVPGIEGIEEWNESAEGSDRCR